MTRGTDLMTPVLQQLRVKGWEVDLVRALEEHRVHEVLVLLPGVHHRLRGQGRAARDVAEDILHRQVLKGDLCKYCLDIDIKLPKKGESGLI